VLTRRARGTRAATLLAPAATLVLVLAATLAVTAGPAVAEPDAECPPGQHNCNVWDNEDGNAGGDGGGGSPGGSNGGSGGNRVCKKDDGTVVPCYDDLRGWFNSADDCYYKLADRQPPETPAGMSAYIRTCSNGPASSEMVFLADPPPGFDPPDPRQLALDLLASVPLAAPAIRTAPDDAPGLVGVPVWLYDASSWEPVPASDSEGGVSVWIEVVPTSIVWTMGDGETLTCESPGVRFRAGVHDPRRPPRDACTHTYARPSDDEAGGTYEITAVKHFTVRWGSSIGGDEEPLAARSAVAEDSIQIDELQVVTR